ncbi:hypothetical protein KBK19_07070 [Microvirga sp. STR05]|uniref:Glycosyltransferase RgtA/B/C/D-like domain-containing protein n=1 Tax=Hymenobacter duratus TaxID=2771356 RepID=A0ABR8JHB4_9BACT|nr:hypothetical protein [Hymenobacter duratus]MBD2714790.1 hypothetical protein [Hymenobacter duratus]MBR7949695.1 hypothetical protein [Microvirga sp. STR05]
MVQPASRSSTFWLPLLALAALVAVRLHGLALAALPDYDSVRNWEIVREVATGNLQNLFHHGSPGFSLVYAPVAWLTADYRVFQHLNALVAVAALAWLVQFVAREVRLAAWETALLLLFAGTSVFLTFSGRDFTAGSWSLLLFVGLLQAQYRRLQHPSRAALLRAAVWLALGLSINYKFLLTLPILLLLELLYGGRLLWQPRTLLRVVAVLLTPYAVLGLLGMADGVPWYRWEAVYYNLVFPGASNAAGRAGHLRFDGLYYLRFLWDFESPMLLPVLAVAAGWLLWHYGRHLKLPRVALLWYLAVWAGCFLLGMSLLLKAPRGLLLAYPLFYLLAFLLLRWALRRWSGRAGPMLLAGVAVLATGFNLYRVQQEIYAYLPTHYGQVAAWLHQHQPGPVQVASTVSLGLCPFLQDTDTLAVAMNEAQLQNLRQQGYRFVLLDGAWRVAGAAPFTSLAHHTPVATWAEPLLTSPLLFLEHSEYTGLGYSATLARQRVARLDSVQLRLYRLP